MIVELLILKGVALIKGWSRKSYLSRKEIILFAEVHKIDEEKRRIVLDKK